MNGRITRKVEQSSVELSLNNKINSSPPDWSRCNSFSSSSSDSTLYCSNSQNSSYSGKKGLKRDKPPTKVIKRSRNSSGSSASSNLSCISDKGLPELVSHEQMSHEINSIENLANISPSSLTLQHDAILNSRLSHTLDLESVLPFRHNLRRNIRKKTCSCDCTTTCTTVVVSRKYKSVGKETVEEKTVISRTKVKTFVDGETPMSKDPLSSERSFEENSLHRKESNKKRRSELDKLYDSLHEIKWAKNFSPDNILRQFDVRQAASCSAFGKSSKPVGKEKTNKTKINEKCNSKTPKNSFDNNYLDSSISTPCKNLYSTRSKSGFSSRKSKCSNQRNRRTNEELSPPVLEKSIVTDDDVLDIDSSPDNSYPVLSKEVLTPEKKTLCLFNKTISNCNLDFSATYNTVQTKCTTFNRYPNKVLNCELRSQVDKELNNIVDCSSTFFNIAEDNIDTIDECFREVGAEVVVSTCCDTDYNLPLLTSVEEIHSPNMKLISDDNPPVLEPLLLKCGSTLAKSSEDSPLKICSDISSFSNYHIEKKLPSDSDKPYKKFFPQISSHLISEESYSLPLSFLNDSGTNTSDDSDKIINVNCKMHFDENCKLNPHKDNKSNIADDNKTSLPEHSETNLDEAPKLQFVENDEINPKKNSKTDLEEYDKANFVEISQTNNFEASKSNSLEWGKTNLFENGKNEEKLSVLGCKNIRKTNLKLSSSLPSLIFIDEAKIFEQETSFDEGPPVLEPCVPNEMCYLNLKSKISISKTIKNESFTGSLFKDKLSGNELNCLFGRKNNFSVTFKNSMLKPKTKRVTRPVNFNSSVAGRQILKKYLRFLNSKSKRQNYVFKRSSNKVKRKCRALCNSYNSSSVVSLKTPLPFKDSPPTSSSFISLMPPLQIVELNNGISSCATCIKSSETVMTGESSTVIQTLNQKLSFTKSQDKITLNQISNSSTVLCPEKKPLILTNKKSKKPFPNNLNNLHNEHLTDISGYSKILASAKKKVKNAVEVIKVPPRVFTCHYQTINVTRGSNYIQIVLKITRGKSVFLTHESLVELNEAITKAGNDKDSRLLILNGFGQTFCLGLDLRPLVGARKNQAVGEIANAVKDLIGTLSEFNKPLVAIVNGAAYGLGLTLLNHADVTLATNNASFCMPYSRLGYMPEGGATLTLPQAVGTTKAMDLILRGQVITAEQARDMGLVNEVVAVHQLPQDLVSRVQAMAGNSISSMETTKAMIKMRLHIQLPLYLETEVKLLPQMWLSPSCQEAIRNTLNSGFFPDC